MKVRGVNFSYLYTRGSVDSRNKKVEQICEEIYFKLIAEYQKYNNIKDSKVSFIKIQELIKEALPEQINFYIARYKKDMRSEGRVEQTKNCNSIVNYRIELPLRNKNLYIEKIPTFMHELTHLLDFAINPQHKVTMEKIFKKNLLNTELKCIYKKLYYTRDRHSNKEIIEKTQKFLKDFSTSEKLFILKSLELEIKTEIHAFKTRENYCNILKLINIESDEYDYNIHDFDKKVDLIKKMRYKIIQNERLKTRITLLINNLKQKFANLSNKTTKKVNYKNK